MAEDNINLFTNTSVISNDKQTQTHQKSVNFYLNRNNDMKNRKYEDPPQNEQYFILPLELNWTFTSDSIIDNLWTLFTLLPINKQIQ